MSVEARLDHGMDENDTKSDGELSGTFNLVTGERRTFCQNDMMHLESCGGSLISCVYENGSNYIRSSKVS